MCIAAAACAPRFPLLRSIYLLTTLPSRDIIMANKVQPTMKGGVFRDEPMCHADVHDVRV